MSGYRNYYDTTFGRSRNENSKKDDDKSTSRITSKYNSYNSNYQRDSSATRDKVSSTVSRIKSGLEKKDNSHPPISYRPLSRQGAKSRDPSPATDKSEKTMSTNFNTSYNKLYPRSYSRNDVSTTTTTTTIPKFTGRSSIVKVDDTIPKYGVRPSTGRDDPVTKYKITKDELPKYISRSSSITKDDSLSKYKSTSRTASREDLTSSSTKYITSRFLPKNSVEKSYTAYTRPSTIRTNETSRKNRELLSALHAQQEQERSRPTSRCSTEDNSQKELSSKSESQKSENQEFIIVSVISRGTSPTPTIQSNLRLRKNEIAKVVEKQITRKKLLNTMVADKECQSDRLDDSTKNSRFAAGTTRGTATPWTSFLDMKFSSPSPKLKSDDTNKTDNLEQNKKSPDSDSPKTISRASSTKSLSQLSIKSDNKKDNSKSSSSLLSNKSKTFLSKQSTDKKQLPPQIPKSDTSKSSLHSLNVANKDFRKSVLNMNPEGKSKKKLGRRSNSVSSAESDDPQQSEATDISENLTSCKSYHSTSSKLPQKSSYDKSSLRISPSSDASTTTTATTTSGSEDDTRKSDKKKIYKTSSRTSMQVSSSEELSMDKFPKPPLSPRPKTDSSKSEVEAKSFLMRALAPVTSFFKNKHDSSEKINWMDNTENSFSQNSENSSEHKRVIKHVESGEKSWWLEQNSIQSEQEQDKKSKPLMKHVDSGEIAWWLDENAEIPEGIETYPNYVGEDGKTSDGRVIYKIRKNDSTNSMWWLDSNEKNSTSENNSKQENIMDTEYLEKHKIRHIDSGERSWWLSSSENISEMVQAQDTSNSEKLKYAIRHQDSETKIWWLQNDDEFDDNNNVPLGDRASPEGLEMPKDNEGRLSPYDNVPITHNRKIKKSQQLFISKHTNIDDILGGTGQIWSPLMDRIFNYTDEEDNDFKEIQPAQVTIHDSTPQRGILQTNRIDNVCSNSSKSSYSESKLDDAALQLYKDGDYGSYLDLEASISEQQEEFEGFQSNKKNSIVLRTQLSVRVHTIIEKLLTSEGRELRRALFSLKQIFQEDKDLVHEFVQNDGLSCLIKVGSEADQNYQNYILRALGQVMLYVDGMNGVMEHNQTIQWLYSLISSKFRLVVKTALKLLLVFVEYTDSNCMLLIKAVQIVDYSQGLLPWHNIMKLLKDFDSADTELLIYATTLINKVLNGVPDQDTYYDQTDALEEQGIEKIIQRYMSKPGTDLDLLQQFQIYEAVLQYEDGEETGVTPPIRHLDENIKKTLRHRKSLNDSSERRKSRRHSTGTAPLYGGIHRKNKLQANQEDDDESSSSSHSELNNCQLNGSYKDSNKATDAGVTPALRRRRERAERQRSFMKEQQESVALIKNTITNGEKKENNIGNYTNALQQRITNGNILRGKDLTPLMNAVNNLDTENNVAKQPWILSVNQQNIDDTENMNENERHVLLQLKRENTVKDLTQKLANQNILHSPSDENKVNRIGDMTGLISKAKEGLAKSKSKADVIKSPPNETIPKIDMKKSENELRWEELISTLNRPLNLCDMDFTDLASEDENDVLAPTTINNGIPPPPPPLLKENGSAPPPPPLSTRIPPPVPSPPIFGVNLHKTSTNINSSNNNNNSSNTNNNNNINNSNHYYNNNYNKSPDTKIPIKKNKKTVKLFWKEVRDDPISTIKLKTGFIWDELSPVSVDTQKLEHLFESRAKDLITKKQQEMNKNKEIIVLDPKRSNAINIGMTKLPPPRSIKTAILKMDATIMNREGIEKLLTMLPTEEERSKIQEAQAANPDLPLGSAEQFLLTLASISELPARLKLWAFKLDFENSEREIAEPLMDLKQGIEVLKINKTFRGILSTLLSIGNFLNGNEVKGFQIDYLAKVPEVKDTVHKHSLLHHLCHIVMEKFPDATDLYSEIGAITRASKVDFDELSLNIQRLESDCKSSWDHLKLIAKHDGSTMMKVKMSDFLADCAERIILVGIIHRRVMNRYHKFLLWLGLPLHQITDTKPNEFCRIVSEFSLEYRTTRERVLQQLEKKANHRERNKTRGKMITDIGKFRTKEDRADAELRQLLGSDISDVESMQGTLPWRRTRRETGRSFLTTANGNLTDGDDEIIESLVKTATKGPARTAPRERKRTRHADRKSLKRSRTRENNPFGSRDSP